MTCELLWGSTRRDKNHWPGVSSKTDNIAEQVPTIYYRGIPRSKHQGLGSEVRSNPARPALGSNYVEVRIRF